jgi:hypothetical protein
LVDFGKGRVMYRDPAILEVHCFSVAELISIKAVLRKDKIFFNIIVSRFAMDPAQARVMLFGLIWFLIQVNRPPAA